MYKLKGERLKKERAFNEIKEQLDEKKENVSQREKPNPKRAALKRIE